MAVVGAVWRADRGGHGGLAELVEAVVAVLVVVVVGGHLAEEGLHASVAAVVQHDDFDDLLTLDERLGPQVRHAGGGLLLLLLLLDREMVGGGARRRLQLRVLRWRRRPLR